MSEGGVGVVGERAVCLQLPEAISREPGRTVWPGGVLLGESLACLAGRTTSDPAELRAAAGAALAMAMVIEEGRSGVEG